MKELGIKNIITGIFVVSAVFALMIFSGLINLDSQEGQASGSVTVWGDISTEIIEPYIEEMRGQDLDLTYIQKRSASYENELVNAFASGTGPDLFIMSHEGLLRHQDKIFEIPYASFPREDYESLYIDEARLFLTNTGATALPIAVDPLIMYYNKPLISSAFILKVPEYWDEFTDFAPQVTEYTGSGEIVVSAVSLGTYDNISNAKAIISALMLQNGNMIVGEEEFSGNKRSLLAGEGGLEAAIQALDFYTSFAEFGTNTYSWNEALINSKNKFIAGEVAVYFGRASEVEEIRMKNPNLDFGVSLLPQLRTSRLKTTQGSMLAVGISKQTKNIGGAFGVASQMSGDRFAGGLSQALLMAPANKALLANKPDDAFGTLVYNSAIISRSWIDPDPVRTGDLFRSIVRNINTGAMETEDALNRADRELNTILDQTINIIIRSKQQL